MLLSRKLIDPRRLAMLAVLGLVSQGALSGEKAVANSQAVVKAAPISAEQIEAETREFIEAVNRRLAEELAETLKDFRNVDTPRVELASAELGTRG